MRVGVPSAIGLRQALLRSARISAIGLLFGVAGCDQETPTPPIPTKANGVSLSDPALKYIAVEPVGESSVQVISRVLPGRLAMRPQALASLGAPAAGRVMSVQVRPGERIAAGEVLVTIQSSDAAAARAALQQAVVKSAAADDALRRQDEMMSKGVGLEFERVEADTAAREARSELERARLASAMLGAGDGDVISLRAPSGGVVMKVRTAVGAVVAPGGDSLVEIADSSRLWLVADVSEVDAAIVAKGQKATFFVPSQNRRLEGVVDGLGSDVDSDTRRLPIYVALEGNLAGLMPGVQAELRFSDDGQGTLMLPVEAVLINDGKKSIVYVQQADGSFVPREVRTGLSKGGMVPILDGLKRGERVVVKGALLLDGEAEQLL